MLDIDLILPLLEPLEPHRWPRRRRWRLRADWRFTLPTGATAVIRAGFIFDGASIPRLFNAIFSPVGILFIPSILHDAGYKQHFLWVETDGILHKTYQHESRRFFDDVFFAVATQLYGHPLAFRIPWLAVRLFGRSAWRRRQATL